MNTKPAKAMYDEKPRFFGHITKVFEVKQRRPIMSADHGATIGQLIDEQIRTHNEMVAEAKHQAAIDDVAYDGMGYLTSITINLPPEE